MTATEIERLAREAGFPFNKFGLLQGDNEGEIDADDMLDRFAVLVQAVERERLACIVRDFPHWLGPQAKRELLAALYGPIATGGMGVDSEPPK